MVPICDLAQCVMSTFIQLILLYFNLQYNNINTIVIIYIGNIYNIV